MNTNDADPADDQYDAVLDRIETLSSEFTDSSYFDELTRHQQREATFVVESTGELLYNYEGKTFEECDERSLETVCTRISPAKISAEPEHFAAVAPVLAAFLRFLGDRGLLDDGEALADHVAALADEIVEAAADPDNWGMAKSMLMGEEPETGDATDLSNPSQLLAGAERQAELSPEEREALEEVARDLDAEEDPVLDEVLRVLTQPDALTMGPGAVLETTDFSPEEFRDGVQELFSRLEAAGLEISEGPGDDEDPATLDTTQAERFLELYGRLLLYVNERFDVVPDIQTYEDFQRAFLNELKPIRDRFYDGNPAGLIAEFVDENPVELSEDDLAQVEAWADYEARRFVVVDHREYDTVFLDPEEPRAFGVNGVHEPLSERFPDERLPVALVDTVLLPFEDVIVPDGWLQPDPLGLAVLDVMGTGVGAAYEEATHTYDVVETLPPGDAVERSDAERLRFYTKNQENRERFADEIAGLKDETPELNRIYHQQLGKSRARALGREFRDMGLDEAYVAIYDGQVVATSPTEADLKETLDAIMPDGKADRPYVYHYDP